MNLRFIDWIWHVRGSLPLAPGQSGEAAFDRLAPLFRQTGTSHERTSDQLTFRKRDAAAQDKMSVFDDGILQIEAGPSGPVLRYDLTSRIMLFCFLAPLLFLAFAQLTIAIGEWEKPPAHAASTAKTPAPKPAVVPMNPIDVALGAPPPEKPKKKDDGAEHGKKPSPTAAYVFAGLFALLYLIGRILEDRLIRTQFAKRLSGG
ncbi:hypothetical protein ACSBM8_09260 [Sphingomonas sp. ASY06-1R]|uniref:hypothetical protein n=1 Tax=Sphingomonas sp. ASY06-1R TaxID=3445771 RepID=UPI003FA2778A